jgi:RHS repeat-associated protein
MFGAYELHLGGCTKNCAAGTPNYTEEQRHILPAGLGLVTLDGAWVPFNGGTANAPPAESYRYFHKDHLGSVVAITDGNGAIKQRIRYDVWGTRSNVALNGDPYLEERGFTGHEHLDEVGFIHMNGRIYDPTIGRFLQADPIIQDASDGQNFNRYSYVSNNPLSLTDPSGFSWWTKWRRTIFAIAVAWFLGPGGFFGANGVAGATLGMTGTAAQAASAIAAGFASGGIQGGNIQSALRGAFFAGLTFGLATEFGLHGPAFEGGSITAAGIQKMAGQMALHAAVGCAQSASSGGSCRSGAIAGGVSAFGSGALGFAALSNTVAKVIANAIIGAVASRLSGGKAENGALSAAFGFLFNEVAEAMKEELRNTPTDSWRPLDGYHEYKTVPYRVCAWAETNCSLANISEIGRSFAVPGKYDVRVSDGDINYAGFGLLVGGWVRTTISADGLTITNTTTLAHVLHPGYIVRNIYAGDDGVYVSTIGVGWGSLRAANVFFGRGYVFPTLDFGMRMKFCATGGSC